MIVDDTNIQIIPLYPFIFVTIDETPVITVRNNNGSKGQVVAVYSGCDWVLVGDFVGYKNEGVMTFSVEEFTYYAVPYTSVFVNYKTLLTA